MWSTLLTTAVDLAGRRRGGRSICPTVVAVAAGAVGLWMAWKSQRRPSRPSRPSAGKETPGPTEEGPSSEE